MNRNALPHPSTMTPELSIGQRIIVMEPDTWLHRRTGTVVALSDRYTGQVAVRIDGHTPLGDDPVRWLDPRRVAPVSTCDTCSFGGGCLCELRDPTAGCGHHGCWGTRRTHDCPGIAAELAQAAAFTFARGW